MILEITILMLAAYLFGWVLGMNFRTLGDDGLRASIKAGPAASKAETPTTR